MAQPDTRMASAARRHSPIPHEPSGSEVSEAEEEPLGSEEAEEESGGESGGGGSSAGAAASEGEEPEESDSDETTASDASVRGSDIVSTLSADVARGAWAGEPAEQAAAAAAAGSAEPPPRPESRESEGSEVDFTRASSGLGPAARGREPPPPSLQEIEASPFIDLAHPVTLYEGAKLLLMAPLVLFKVGAARGGRGSGRRVVNAAPAAGPCSAAACAAPQQLHSAPCCTVRLSNH